MEALRGAANTAASKATKDDDTSQRVSDEELRERMPPNTTGEDADRLHPKVEKNPINRIGDAKSHKSPAFE